MKQLVLIFAGCVLAAGCGSVSQKDPDAGDDMFDAGPLDPDATDGLDAGPTPDSTPTPDAGADEATLSLILTGAGTGTVVSSPAGIDCPGTCSANFATGTEVTLLAQADDGSGFYGWVAECPATSLEPCALTMDENRSAGARFEPGGMVLSANEYGGSNADFAYRAATDSGGNLIIAGTFTGSLNLGGSNLNSATNAAGASTQDVFVAKYDSAGAHVWSVRYGGGGRDEVWGLDVSSANEVFIGGQFNADISFGGTTLNHQASEDAYLVKLSGTNGGAVWAKGFHGTSNVKTWDLAVTSTDDVVMSFYFKGTANFGDGNVNATVGDDFVLARYSGSNGSLVWSNEFGGIGIGGTAGDDQVTSVEVDATDNIFVSGYFNGTINLGGSNLAQTGTGRDQFVARFTSGGAHTWSKSIGSTASIFSGSGVVDGSGNFVVASRFSGTVDFGGGPVASTGDLDISIVKYAGSDGSHVWSERYSGTGYKGVSALGLMSNGDIAVAGFYNGDMVVGGSTASNASRTNLFVGRLARDTGDPVWMTHFGDDAGGGGGRGRGLAVGAADRVHFLGTFNDSVSFGTGNDFTSANGVEDIAVVTLLP